MNRHINSLNASDIYDRVKGKICGNCIHCKRMRKEEYTYITPKGNIKSAFRFVGDCDIRKEITVNPEKLYRESRNPYCDRYEPNGFDFVKKLIEFYEDMYDRANKR